MMNNPANPVREIIRKTILDMLTESMSNENFNSTKRYGPIYTPSPNILRGAQLFERFLHIPYTDVDGYLSEIGDDPDILAMFDKMYVAVRNQQLDKKDSPLSLF